MFKSKCCKLCTACASIWDWAVSVIPAAPQKVSLNIPLFLLLIISNNFFPPDLNFFLFIFENLFGYSGFPTFVNPSLS